MTPEVISSAQVVRIELSAGCITGVLILILLVIFQQLCRMLYRISNCRNTVHVSSTYIKVNSWQSKLSFGKNDPHKTNKLSQIRLMRYIKTYGGFKA